MNYTVKLPKIATRSAFALATAKGQGLRGATHHDRRAPRGGDRNEQLELLSEYEEFCDEAHVSCLSDSD